ncbi:MAG TPA: hypothetical protein VIJ78_00990 [Pseudolabrys sp.]
MTEFSSVVVASLRELGFSTNELAYLAITSKIEGAVRDRLAFALHNKLEGRFVTREWNRVDLAVLNANRQPDALIELKAMYTFDPLLKGRYYTDATSRDEEKAFGKGGPAAEVYSLLLASHLHAQVPIDLKQIAKYSSGVNKCLKQYETHDAVRAAARERVKDELRGRDLVRNDILGSGSAFGIEVSVEYWLVRRAWSKVYEQ